MQLEGETVAIRTYKRQTSSKKSILIPLVITLVLFIAAGFLMLSYFKEFYHTEKTHEATLLARTYAKSLESTLDARSLLNDQFHTTLRVAGNIAAMQEKPFSNEMLADLAQMLTIDVFYVFDRNLEIRYSSVNLYLGWVAPKGHPVRTFYESGIDHYVDEIRTDSETDTYWMYSYQRLANGGMIQSGILADKLAELSSQLTEQSIIDQIVHESPLTQISFINPHNIITASSIPEEIGQSIDDATLTRLIEEGPTHLSFKRGSLDWHLKLYLPIQFDGTSHGTLSFLFDLSNTNRLFVQISATILIFLITLFILFAISIINIANKNKRIFNVAYFDEVTGLPNIRYLKRVLQEQDHKDLALIIINPLHFKFINLIYGYNYGDTLLYEIATDLAAIDYKEVNLQTYRFTDDQFIITVKNYGSQEVLSTLCKQILSIHEKPGILGSVDIAIGVVVWNKLSIDFDTIIKKASIALSAASKDNPIQFYTEETEEALVRQDTIETELKKVLAGEEGILHLAYQPIVDAKKGLIVSFEALARMQSSILGSVPPQEFIAIAEERHLIIPLGKIILEQASLFIKKLTELGYGSYPIGVNVSAMQLLDESLVEAIKEITRRVGIETKQLEIELTESVFSNDFEFLSQQIERINALGIRIAIDDFGTGFSSLNRLRGLIVDMLKLDKQFVDKLLDKGDTSISSDIISMAHHLGKQIIAEGVETEEQRQLLLDMGCDLMQGYLFSRPVGEEEVIRLLSEGLDGS